MAQYVQTNSGLLVAGLDLSADADVGFNAVGLTLGSEAVQANRYVNSGANAAQVTPGLKTAQVEAEGYFSEVEDAALFGGFTETTPGSALDGFAVTICPEGRADGDPAYFMRATQGQYQPMGSGELGDMLRWKLSASVRAIMEGAPDQWPGAAIKGTVAMDVLAAGTGAQAGQQLGALSATQRLWVAVHLFDAAGAVGFDIESDDNGGFTTATQRIDVPDITVSGSWAGTVLGAITDDYWRVNIISGSGVDALIAFGIL